MDYKKIISKINEQLDSTDRCMAEITNIAYHFEWQFNSDLVKKLKPKELARLSSRLLNQRSKLKEKMEHIRLLSCVVPSTAPIIDMGQITIKNMVTASDGEQGFWITSNDIGCAVMAHEVEDVLKRLCAEKLQELIKEAT